jgi:DNA invertase Pin-like site-specific DNA recombinase
MAFALVGGVAELEGSLIVERVRAGLRSARVKGRKLGRPRVAVHAHRITLLRQQGHSWSEIVKETGVSKGSAQRAVRRLSQI